jgi:uncharacterized protein YprB with RNaseH-like and TPR domain
MPKKNKRWTHNEDRTIIEQYISAPKTRRCSLAELTSTLNWIHDKGRTQDAVRSRAHTLRRQVQAEGTRGRQKLWFDGAKVGYFDIETYGFKANFGLMLSWAMFVPKEVRVQDDGSLKISKKGKTYHDFMKRNEAIDYKKLDKRITGSLLDAINEVDIVVGYYSTRFDVPFTRTRAAKWEVPFPKYQDKYHADMWFVVRSLYSLSRNTLQQACALFGIDGKTHVDYDLWDRARLGDPDAMAYVDDHCVADVEILARLHEKISGYRPLTRRSL